MPQTERIRTAAVLVIASLILALGVGRGWFPVAGLLNAAIEPWMGLVSGLTHLMLVAMASVCVAAAWSVRVTSDARASEIAA